MDLAQQIGRRPSLVQVACPGVRRTRHTGLPIPERPRPVEVVRRKSCPGPRLKFGLMERNLFRGSPAAFTVVRKLLETPTSLTAATFEADEFAAAGPGT